MDDRTTLHQPALAAAVSPGEARVIYSLAAPSFSTRGILANATGVVDRRLDQHQVVCEFDEHATVRSPAEEPDARGAPLRHLSE